MRYRLFLIVSPRTAEELLLDLDSRLAQKLAPRARFLLHQLLELRGRSRERDLEHLLGQALFDLRIRQDRGVGPFGSSASRPGAVVASAFILPERTCGNAEDKLRNATGASPEMIAGIICPAPPLYGT